MGGNEGAREREREEGLREVGTGWRERRREEGREGGRNEGMGYGGRDGGTEG